MKTFLVGLFCYIICANSMFAQTNGMLLKVPLLYDSEAKKFQKDQEIYIEGDRIKAVGKNLTIAEGTKVIDLQNATITPGLIDAHTHILTSQKPGDNLAIDSWINSDEKRVLRAAKFAREYLESGFTAIRDLGNSGYYLDLEVASAIRNGFIQGPQMFCSGPILSAIDGQFYQIPYDDRRAITEKEYRIIIGVEDAIQAVKEHVNNGVDVIKIVAFGERMGLELDEMKAIVKTAHALGKKVTAHSTGGPSMAKAIEAGVDGIEHAYSIEDSLLKKMAADQIYIVPTDPSFNSVIQNIKASNQTDFDTLAIRKELAPLKDRIMRAKHQNVMLVAGSDAYMDIPVSRGDAAKETLVAYVEQGLSVEEALQTATRNAAVAIGHDKDMGVIKVGMKANLVIFKGDLQKDYFSSLFNVQMVLKDGKIVYTHD